MYIRHVSTTQIFVKCNKYVYKTCIDGSAHTIQATQKSKF